MVIGLLALGNGDSAAAQSMADVVVAVPAPLADDQGRSGLAVHAAAQLVAADINAAGGINGANLVIAIRRDPCNSTDAASAASALAADTSIAAIIGHPCAASARVAASVYAQAGRLFLAAGPLTPLLAKPTTSDLVFQLPGPATAQATYLGRAMAAAASQAPDARIALIRDKTQSAVAYANAIETALRAAGQPPSQLEIFAGGDKGFAGLAQRLVAAKITHVALLAFPVEAGPITRELVAAIPDIALFGSDALATDDVPTLAGPGASRLRLALQVELKTLITRDARAAAFADRLRAAGVTPTRDALYTAAALQVWAAAARSADAITPAAVAAQLRSEIGFDTVLGSVQFSATGDAQLPAWSLYRWVNNQLEPE